MNEFQEYYSTNFRNDIARFFSTIPAESKFHHGNGSQEIYTIQEERLNPAFGHLDFLTKSDKEYFGIALFFTVLVDMVCYSEFRNHYRAFGEKTRYPKLIGNCLAACHYHSHPGNVFYSMNRTRGLTAASPRPARLDFRDKFVEAVPVMQKETIDFLTLYVADIDAEKFWEKFVAEFPTKQKMKMSGW